MRYAHLGLRVDGEWFCSTACVAAAASQRLREVRRRSGVARPVPTPRLGALLVHQGAITSAQLADAIASQRSSGRKLGAEVRALGYADAHAVLRALAMQANTSYLTAIDPDCVRSAPANLCTGEIRALGIVPMRLVDAERLALVACIAPVPYAALRAFQELTGLRTMAYLVTEEDFDTLVNRYGVDLPTAVTERPSCEVDGVYAAAQRIAHAAAAGGDIRVSQAHVDRFTWVRVAWRDGTDAMLVIANAADAEEDDSRWQADITRH